MKEKLNAKEVKTMLEDLVSKGDLAKVLGKKKEAYDLTNQGREKTEALITTNQNARFYFLSLVWNDLIKQYNQDKMIGKFGLKLLDVEKHLNEKHGITMMELLKIVNKKA